MDDEHEHLKALTQALVQKRAEERADSYTECADENQIAVKGYERAVAYLEERLRQLKDYG